MIRTRRLHHRRCARASIRLRVSAVSGVCRVMKSHRGQRSSSRRDALDRRAPGPSRPRGTGRSRPPSCRSPGPAWRRPGRPGPGRRCPASCPRAGVPVKSLRSHLPALRLSLAWATLRASDEHQRHGVLGRRDRVAARRVHHHDALAGRGRDVDVVDADAGADDRLEPGLVRQDVGRQLRARADRDAVGLVQRLRRAPRGPWPASCRRRPRCPARPGAAPGLPRPACRSPARDAPRSQSP